VENHVFPRAAVAAVLKEKFVEARLHTDIQSHLTAAQFATNRKKQRELASSIGNPFFVIVDPATGRKLRETGLSGGPSAYEGVILEFLKGGGGG
jgi:hypothetical protein